MLTDAVLNLGSKALRRLLSLHKPFVRMARRHARRREQRQYLDDALGVDRQITAVARGSAPIVAGPWLAEVGYEVLYWVPFLRWFADAHRIPPERLVVVSRGGVKDWYTPFAGHYVDILDVLSPAELAAGNTERQAGQERGGQKQSSEGSLDRRILDAVDARLGTRGAARCHPSLLFRLFQQVWYGSLPLDFFWTRTRYERSARPASSSPWLPADLPEDFIAVKFYSGTALPLTSGNQAIVRSLVARAAEIAPVISLDADYGFDEHRDFDLRDLPRVRSAREWMTPGTNLAVQSALLARSQSFLGTCGGLAWLAPFMGVPTTAVYADDQLLGTHLMIAKQAGRAVGAAEFSLLDLRALGRLGLDARTASR
ncbi:MAG: hypothetical protein FJW23_14250 [Acidimicrobiia bacterium]|nr:hypothetical protein [Acidimicrobiia bacterium]